MEDFELIGALDETLRFVKENNDKVITSKHLAEFEISKLSKYNVLQGDRDFLLKILEEQRFIVNGFSNSNDLKYRYKLTFSGILFLTNNGFEGQRLKDKLSELRTISMANSTESLATWTWILGLSTIIIALIEILRFLKDYHH